MTLPASGPVPNANNDLVNRIQQLEATVRELSRSKTYTIKRNDGSIAFEVSSLGTGETFWVFYDALGNVVAAEDATAGTGLARPWIPVPAIPLRSEMIPTITGASFVRTYGTGDALQVLQPKLRIQSLVWTHSGAAGEIRYQINDQVVGSVESIGVDQFTWSSVQDLDIPSAYGSNLNVFVECRVTNGVGNIGAIFVATQRQS